jgi:[glutamine synthetase] adenylyltransferase / [glutamine synthetase]-adenylyl-L-tyrosine phosphorylase
MRSDQEKHRRFEAVSTGSRTLAELLHRDQAAAAVVDDVAPLPDRTDYAAILQGSVEASGLGGLRAEKRRRLLQIAARDLAGEIPLEVVGRALADLADACLEVTLAAVAAPPSLAVIGMGKLGARELNYSSDIDVMFVAGDDLEASTRAAEALLRELGEVAPEGQAFRIDVDLRPEGRSGALVRSLDGCLEYYRRWADEWEFQALIKARPAAGDGAVGQALVDQTRPLVFPKHVGSERVVAIRRMKERVEDQALRAARRARSVEIDDVKLGPGGIRDIEFSVQLFQLVHGGSDESVRNPTTLDALSALVDGGYVADDDGAGLSVAYRWLRRVEHRLQLWAERRVHRLPADDEGRARVARAMGFHDSPAASAIDRFNQTHRAVLADVRARFEKLFYRPLIESLAEVGPHALSKEALQERLRILGFRDVARAARVLDGLVSGSSRRARLFRVLTPFALRRLASSPSPDEGLFSFLRLGEALEDRIDVLGALRDNPPAISFLAQALGSGRVVGDMLTHVPDELVAVAETTGPEQPRDRESLVREALASLEWREPARRRDGLRRFKRRALLRIILADLVGVVGGDELGSSLADLAEACLETSLQDPAMPFAIIGMGKLGGRELNYASDLDVMFVHDGDPQEAEKLAEDVLSAIGALTPEGQTFQIDAGLRPEGKAGPLARTLKAYREYYARWAQPWERQSLLKARLVAGDVALGEALFSQVVSPAHAEPISAEALAEVRHLKARMEKERIPRGTDPRRNLKLGPGGMSDIEFSAQILQLAGVGEHPELRVQGTAEALEAAAAVGLIGQVDSEQLTASYRWLATLRNKLFLLVGRPVDDLPVRPEDLESLGIAMGYEDQPRQELEEEYLRVTRRARAVAERIIYG